MAAAQTYTRGMPPDAVTSAPAGRRNAKDAFRMAMALFRAGERIDMQDLAAELGVDRTTLFRWVGNRDKLIVDILLTLTDGTLEDVVEAVDAVGDRGGARLADIAGAYADKIVKADYYRQFLRREPERSLRLLTTAASPVQRHVVQRFERLICEEVEAGWAPPLAPHDLSYLVVRIIESFIYADLITGEAPDPGKVRTAVAALLGVGPR